MKTRAKKDYKYQYPRGSGKQQKANMGNLPYKLYPLTFFSQKFCTKTVYPR